MPPSDGLSAFLDKFKWKPELKVYASLIREIDDGFTLFLAYFVPHSGAKDGAVRWLYGPHGSLLFEGSQSAKHARPQEMQPNLW
jgi:hypothetical protein